YLGATLGLPSLLDKLALGLVLGGHLGSLQLDPAPLGLRLGFLLLELGLLLLLRSLGSELRHVVLGLPLSLLQPALALQVLAAQRRAGKLLHASGQLAERAAGGFLLLTHRCPSFGVRRFPFVPPISAEPTRRLDRGAGNRVEWPKRAGRACRR